MALARGGLTDVVLPLPKGRPLRPVVAVDIGGTKVAAAAVLPDGTVGRRAVAPTPHGDASEVFATVTGVVDAVRSGDEEACGVASAGPLHAGGAVSPVNIPAWREFPLREALAAHTGLAVFVAGDAQAFALAEGWMGAGRGERCFVAAVVSTGIGGGIVLDGRLLHGRTGNAGHIGHVNVRPEGRQCGCGAQGCLEAEASGTAIEKVTGRPPAEAGDDIRRLAGRLVGRAVGGVANLLDLRLAVVGGSVALGFGEPFFESARHECARVARLAFSSELRVVPSGLGADGGLLGAALVAWLGRR